MVGFGRCARGGLAGARGHTRRRLAASSQRQVHPTANTGQRYASAAAPPPARLARQIKHCWRRISASDAELCVPAELPTCSAGRGASSGPGGQASAVLSPVSTGRPCNAANKALWGRPETRRLHMAITMRRGDGLDKSCALRRPSPPPREGLGSTLPCQHSAGCSSQRIQLNREVSNC